MPDAETARATGLAGASVALADDDSGLDQNPAALGTLERSELTAALAARRSGSTRGGDHLVARTGLGQVGAATRLGAHWALGGYFLEPQARRVELRPSQANGFASDTGSLETVTTDVGGALAFALSDRLQAGVRVTATHLSLAGLVQTSAAHGPVALSVGSGGGSTKLITTAGLLFRASRALRLGVIYTPEASWSFTRRAVSPWLGLDLDGGTVFSVRRPSLLAGGLSWRLSPHVLALAQVDSLRVGPLADGLPGGYEQLAHARRDFRARGGLELAWPLGRFAVQLRAGVEGPWPRATVQRVAAPAPDGPAPAGTSVRWQAFQALNLATGLWERPDQVSFDSGGDPGSAVTGGVSLTVPLGLRLDAGARFSRERSFLALGLALRL